MAATELAPLVLGEADVASALALWEEAGWDQTAADWRLMVRLDRDAGFGDPALVRIAAGPELG